MRVSRPVAAHAVGLAGVLVVVGLSLATYLSYRAATTPRMATCGCGTWSFMPGSQVQWPAAVAGTILMIILLAMSWDFTRRIIADRRLSRDLNATGIAPLGQTSVTRTVWAVKTAKVFAVTVGLWKPRVYVSQGLANILTRAELAAVLLHEDEHARKRHPLISAILGSIAWGLFFVPGLRNWVEVSRAEQEVEADYRASRAYRDVATLASALDKIESVTLSAGIAWSALNHRIDCLICGEDKWAADQRRTRRKLMLWVTAVAIMVTVTATTTVRLAQAGSTTLRRCEETRRLCQQRPQVSPAAVRLMSFNELR